VFLIDVRIALRHLLSKRDLIWEAPVSGLRGGSGRVFYNSGVRLCV